MACSHCTRHRSRHHPAPSGTVQYHPVPSGNLHANYMHIALNMAADVADVVLASPTFLYVFETDLSEEENNEEECRQRKRRRPLRFWIHDVNHRRELCASEVIRHTCAIQI